MGSSIEFVMSEGEENKLVEFLNSLHETAMLSACSSTDCPEVIKKFHNKGESLFWNKAYIARVKDIKMIKMICAKSCGHYVIEDTYEAPVIEIRREVGSKNGYARIYGEFRYYKDGEENYKGEEFENLYKKLETWIKINYSIVEPEHKKYRQYCYY